MDRLIYHQFAGIGDPDGARCDAAPVAEGFPERWSGDYAGGGLHLIDPVIERCRTETRPFFWSDVDRLPRLQPAQQDLRRRLRAAGLGEGLAFPVYGPQARNGCIALGFVQGRTTLCPEEVQLCRCAGQAAHLRYCELVDDAGRGQVTLTPREVETLQWIARGKSNNAIATILDVSPHTVDTLVRRIFAKLDVTDRTTAAIRGIATGLISPDA